MTVIVSVIWLNTVNNYWPQSQLMINTCRTASVLAWCSSVGVSLGITATLTHTCRWHWTTVEQTTDNHFPPHLSTFPRDWFGRSTIFKPVVIFILVSNYSTLFISQKVTRTYLAELNIWCSCNIRSKAKSLW